MSKKLVQAPFLCLFLGSSVLAAGQPSVPPASFLNYHVSTVQQLSQQVTLDPAVRRRLARHFHISESQMTTYIRRNLVLTKLHKAGYYHVACVKRNGEEYWVESHLPAGTPVFASRVTGSPVLKLACGNPMVSSLPPSIRMADNQGELVPPQLASSSIAIAPAPVSPPSLLPDAVPLPDVTNGPMLADNAIVPPVVQVSPSLETFTQVARHGFSLGPALGGLAAAAAAVAINNNHGGTPTPNVPAVPENSTAVSLGLMLMLGSAVVIVRRRKRPSFD